MRAVCRPFRSQIPPPPNTIIPRTLKVPFPDCYSGEKRGHFLLTEASVYAIQPLHKISNAHNTTKTWIIKVQQSTTGSGKVLVKDPLSTFVFDKLPAETERLPQSLNFLDYRVDEIAKAYALELYAKGEGETFNYMFKEGHSILFQKVVVSTRLDHKNDLQYSIMALLRTGSVGVFRSEVKTWSFVDIGPSHSSNFEDVEYHDKKFYALGARGLTVSVDCKSLDVTHVAGPVLDWHISGRKFLAKWSRDRSLYFILKYYVDDCSSFIWGMSSGGSEEFNYPARFKIFKLDEKKHSWVRVCVRGKEWENRVVFVGNDCSYIVSAKDFPGCKINCVYFSENAHSTVGFNGNHPGAYAMLYDFDDDFAGPLSALPFYSNIFWPPPSWLRPNPAGPGPLVV